MLFPESFIIDVSRLLFFLDDYDLGGYGNALRGHIRNQVTAKLENIERSNAFAMYKSAAPGSEEREAYRKKYLELSGIHKDWVSDDESSF